MSKPTLKRVRATVGGEAEAGRAGENEGVRKGNILRRAILLKAGTFSKNRELFSAGGD